MAAGGDCDNPALDKANAQVNAFTDAITKAALADPQQKAVLDAQTKVVQTGVSFDSLFEVTKNMAESLCRTMLNKFVSTMVVMLVDKFRRRRTAPNRISITPSLLFRYVEVDEGLHSHTHPRLIRDRMLGQLSKISQT